MWKVLCKVGGTLEVCCYYFLIIGRITRVEKQRNLGVGDAVQGEQKSNNKL